MFPSLHINPGRIIFEDDKFHVCSGRAKAATKQILIPWLAFQCGCELEVPRLQQHHLCGSPSSARPQWGTVRAAALFWRGALIIQKLWWEIIAKGFSTQVAIVQEVVVPRLLRRNFAHPGFPWRRWSLEFLCLQREVRPLPWTVMIHQMKWGNPSQHSNLTCTKPSKMCVQTPACSTPKGNSPPTRVSHCHGKITMS